MFVAPDREMFSLSLLSRLWFLSIARMRPGGGKSDAKWIVLCPGAAQASITFQFGSGFNAWATSELPKPWRNKDPFLTKSWSCNWVPGGNFNTSGNHSMTSGEES